MGTTTFQLRENIMSVEDTVDITPLAYEEDLHIYNRTLDMLNAARELTAEEKADKRLQEENSGLTDSWSE